MGKMMAMIALFGLSQAAWADDFSVNTPTLDASHLPKKGVVSYEGTWATTGAWTGVSGPVQLVVNFGTGDVSADLTIPWLGAGSTASLARRFAPQGRSTLTVAICSRKASRSRPTSRSPRWLGRSPTVRRRTPRDNS
jgi:hypothetical protein